MKSVSTSDFKIRRGGTNIKITTEEIKHCFLGNTQGKSPSPSTTQKTFSSGKYTT